MTVPNLLTLSRILLTPLLIWFLVQRKLNEALVVFFIAGITDGLDGLIARLLQQKSRLGAIMDPLADKFLLVSSLLILCRIGLIPGWLVIIAVARDVVIVMGTTVLLVLRYQVEIRPTLLGKLTTLTQLLAVLLTLSSSLITVSAWIYSLVFAVTAVFSVASGAQYVRNGISCWNNPK
jgi:cardiolipin synthase (CMP-forming)